MMDKVTLQNLSKVLDSDPAVKVAGIDVDGVLRGKLMSKDKFLSIAETGFGFCSVVFGWDMHDQVYTRELAISNNENGYRDIVAVPDLASFRRIPWENNVPFFLLSFKDPDSGDSLSVCPRSVLKRCTLQLEKKGWKAMAGGASHPIFSVKGCTHLVEPRLQPSTNSSFSDPQTQKTQAPSVTRLPRPSSSSQITSTNCKPSPMACSVTASRDPFIIKTSTMVFSTLAKRSIV